MWFNIASSYAFHLSLVVFLKLDLNHECSEGWLCEMNAGGTCDHCLFLSFFGFLRPDLLHWEYMSRCFAVALRFTKDTKLERNNQETSPSDVKKPDNLITCLYGHIFFKSPKSLHYQRYVNQTTLNHTAL